MTEGAPGSKYKGSFLGADPFGISDREQECSADLGNVYPMVACARQIGRYMAYAGSLFPKTETQDPIWNVKIQIWKWKAEFGKTMD
jgi:hypothetical protein